MNGESLLFKQVKYFEVREKTHTLLQWRFDDFFLFVRAERIHGLISMLGAKCLFWTLQNVVTKVNMSITTSVKFMCATKSTCILHGKNTIFFLLLSNGQWLRLVFQSFLHLFILEFEFRRSRWFSCYWSAQLPGNKWNALRFFFSFSLMWEE